MYASSHMVPAYTIEVVERRRAARPGRPERPGRLAGTPGGHSGTGRQLVLAAARWAIPLLLQRLPAAYAMRLRDRGSPERRRLVRHALRVAAVDMFSRELEKSTADEGNARRLAGSVWSNAAARAYLLRSLDRRLAMLGPGDGAEFEDPRSKAARRNRIEANLWAARDVKRWASRGQASKQARYSAQQARQRLAGLARVAFAKAATSKMLTDQAIARRNPTLLPSEIAQVRARFVGLASDRFVAEFSRLFSDPNAGDVADAGINAMTSAAVADAARRLNIIDDRAVPLLADAVNAALAPHLPAMAKLAIIAASFAVRAVPSKESDELFSDPEIWR
ncbi:hypothetical protein [Ensifer adhaerens]|uniref:hypothetical protein n=1 Tax=Ensifer adhaerens TaxID=106592 RepID=UPI00098F9A35|nr:hypothetical protein [Ensifer adhaerens]